MSLEQEMNTAQTLGLIKGLTSVVQEQSNAMKATSDQIQHLAITVENLTKVQQAPVLSSQSLGLRLPNLVLLEYTGKEPLDRFLEQIESLLISSAVPTKHWITYLKQQCQKDTRAYDALNSAHQTTSVVYGIRNPEFGIRNLELVYFKEFGIRNSELE